MKHTVKRITFFVFSIIIALLCVFCWQKPVDSYSDNTSRLYVQNQGDLRLWITIEYYNGGIWTQVAHWDGYTQNIYLDPAYIYRVSSFAWFYEYQGSVLSSSFDNPTHLRGQGSNQNYSRIYFNNDTASVSHYQYFTLYDYVAPTPTPTPTVTPAPATPTPDPFDVSDQAFWGRVSTYSSGFWDVLRSIFTNLFGNVVTRNLCVYLPLMGLIITLIIYFISFGGRDG